MTDLTLSDKLHSLLQSKLQPSERVLWSGQPSLRLVNYLAQGGFVLMMQSFFPIYLGVGIAYAIYRSFDPVILKTYDMTHFYFLWSCVILFLLPGLAILFYPFYAGAYELRRTLYAVTSNRVFFIQPRFFGKFKVSSYPLANLLHFSCKQSKNGNDKLRLRFISPRNKHTNTYRFNLNFYGIPDVRAVEKILVTMRDENLRVQPSQNP